tara:strand:- start:389 stop:1018 length:630 start_codon:yes stop_codon:yes gene_type:complete
MILTFGKYKNTPISDIFDKDKQYIKWLCSQDWFEINHKALYDYSFQILNDYKPVKYEDRFIVYTDGACPNNGNSKAKSSIGIHFSEKNPIVIEDVSEKLYTSNHSNNIAELSAILKCFELMKEKDIKIPIYLYTDSKYCMSILTEWYEKWIRAKLLQGKKNLPLIQKTYELYKSFENIEILHIKGHSKKTDEHSYGNIIADQLARNALK